MQSLPTHVIKARVIEVIKWKHLSKKDHHTCCVVIQTANAMTSPIVSPNTSTREDHPTVALP